MSGGKKVWINECLTRGIALYRAQDSGQSFQTLFTDEGRSIGSGMQGRLHAQEARSAAARWV